MFDGIEWMARFLFWGSLILTLVALLIGYGVGAFIHG